MLTNSKVNKKVILSVKFLIIAQLCRKDMNLIFSLLIKACETIQLNLHRLPNKKLDEFCSSSFFIYFKLVSVLDTSLSSANVKLAFAPALFALIPVK